MLGRTSDEVVVHLVGDIEPALPTAGRELSGCCKIEEGFLRKTFRDDFPLNSWGCPADGGLLDDLPNPNLVAAIPLGLVSGTILELGDGSRMLGLGSAVCTGLLSGTWPLLGSICPDMCAMSASLCSNFAGPGCMYVPCLLLLEVSPGRVGGSNPALYDAIMFLLSKHYFSGNLCAVVPNVIICAGGVCSTFPGNYVTKFEELYSWEII
jgi:hypothetical protein